MILRLATLISLSLSLVVAGCTDNDYIFPADAVPTDITIAPADAVRAVNVSERYTAIATFPDGSQRDVTRSSVWSSSATEIAEVGKNTGLVLTQAEGVTSISAQFNGVAADTTLTVGDSRLTQIQITPANAVDPAGTIRQFTAIGFYSDGSAFDISAQAIWSSADTSILGVVEQGENGGLASFISEGTASLNAAFQGLSNTVPVTVTAPLLKEIVVDPIEESAPVGTTVQYRATGIYSDGTSTSLKEEVTWSSSDPVIASIDKAGAASALSEGLVEIVARFEGKSGSAQLRVEPAALRSVQIVPGQVTEPAGTQVQLRLIALYSDLSTGDVTAEALWRSADPSIAVVQPEGDKAGLTTLVSPGSSIVTAMFGGQSSKIDVTVTDAVLVEIEIEPSDEEFAAGAGIQYTATGIFSDGSSKSLNDEVSWQSSDIDVATIDLSGFATALTPGITTIQASTAGISGSTGLTVTAATLVSLQVLPAVFEVPAGTSGQLTAQAIFSDNSTRDVTEEATWDSLNDQIVSVVPNGPGAGFATAVTAGNTTITATFEGVGSTADAIVTDAVLTAIEITPALTATPAGTDVQYQAVGLFSDGSTEQITGQVNWSSTDTSVATVDTSGLAQTTMPGATMIRAALDGITQTAELIVLAAAQESLTVTPAGLSEPAGTSGKLIATVTLTDGTTQDVSSSATWTSSDETIVDVVTTGVDGGFIELLSQSTAQVTAQYEGISDTVDIEVTAAVLVDIIVEPPTSSIATGTGLQYNASGVYSDGTVSTINDDVVWTSTDNSVATITQAGVATGVNTGFATIQASAEGLFGSASLEVTPATIVSISVTPQTQELARGLQQQYTASALLSDASTQDITADAVWSVNEPTLASISNANGSNGLLTALDEGMLEVQADYEGINGIATLTILPPTVQAVMLIPENNDIPKGTQSQWSAEAMLSNGDVLDITTTAAWFSDNNSIATATAGLINGIELGSTNININYQGFTDAEPVTVTAPLITDLSITPSLVELDVGGTQQMIATARFTDGTNTDVTEDVDWFTSDTSSARINNTLGSKGLLTALSPGSADISATFEGITYTDAVVNVLEPQLASIRVEPVVATTAPGSTILYRAIGVYTDSSERDLTEDAGWAVSDIKIATISNEPGSKGQLLAKSPGSITITASVDDGGIVTGTANLAVTGDCGSGNPDSIRIAPEDSTLSLGASGQLEILATYGDCEENVTLEQAAKFKTQDPDVVTVNRSSGVTVGVGLGVGQIEGSYKGETATATVTVIADEVGRVRINILGTIVASIGDGEFSLQCEAENIVNGVLQPPVSVTGTAEWYVDNREPLIEGLIGGGGKGFLPTEEALVNVTCNYGGKESSVSVRIVP